MATQKCTSSVVVQNVGSIFHKEGSHVRWSTAVAREKEM